MFNRFKLKGNVSGAIRSDEELASIDKRAADETFKIQKKRLDAFLQQKGFVKYKTNSYLRRNRLNVLEYIDLQKERYGSRTFTVNYALTSLYVPHAFFSFDLGDRLGKLICDKDVWWDYANEQIAEVSFNNVIEAIEIVLLPWFEEMENLESIRKELTTQKKKRESHCGRLSDTQAFWLDAIEKDTWDEAIVLSNIETFKLPKKLS
ncbi:DUF4304 domain-containing protein [Butyrivibrio proteoclasticus]|uniref:DUF4304 domain-containing protein n=1 Tax=Butyrivibrio proteoclasticus TaxID=43305 RepID=UPI00047A307B|nr:DUF4304 domain-containing protein [Butyrivibrio proteoclasticus]